MSHEDGRGQRQVSGSTQLKATRGGPTAAHRPASGGDEPGSPLRTRGTAILLHRRFAIAALLLCLFAWAMPTFAAPRVGVVTMLPGEIFWERFGHNAIVVADARGDTAISYNFGFFDLEEPDFVGRFIQGDMRYRLVALPFEEDMVSYRQDGRGVSIQWLDLDDTDARQLAEALAWNARPENARYRYDYFLDNCSTRVRDALDRALGGRLRSSLEGRSRGNTFRSESLRLASPAPWLWLGFDIGLGPSADLPLSLWREAFVPMRLADALRDVRKADGEPLVLDEQRVFPHRLAPEPQGAAMRWPLWALVGIVIAAGMVWLGRTRPRALAAMALPVWTVAGLAGAVMLYIWFGTEHQFGWANQNLLLFNPLSWLLLPGAWRLARGRPAGRWFDALLAVMVACAVLAVFMHWLPVAPQRNLHWIALLLPLHAGLWLALRDRRPAPSHGATGA